MEPRFEHDFSRVRVHADPLAAKSARDVDAHAYTVGNHIVFGAGHFAPGTNEGQQLLAHELGHVAQQSRSGAVMLQRQEGGGGPPPPPEPLQTVAERIAQLALGPNQAAVQDRLGSPRGPVVSVVRNTATGEIFVGLNTGLPDLPSDLIQSAISAQQGRIARGEIHVVHSIDPGTHSEVNAVNSAVASYERTLRRTVTEEDLRVFELHNVWLSGTDRRLTAAPRCEHCARITRGVSVTSGLFKAEGGVSGDITVPQRGSVTPAGGGPRRAVTSASGEIDTAAAPAPPRNTPSGAAGLSSRPGIIRTAAGVSSSILTALITEYLTTKLREHLDKRAFEQRLRELQPKIDAAKDDAFHATTPGDRAWMRGQTLYWIVTLQITSRTTVVIGGGHAMTLSGVEPELVSVAISSSPSSPDGPIVEKTAVVAPAHHAVIQLESSQLVAYSEPMGNLPMHPDDVVAGMRELDTHPFFGRKPKAAPPAAPDVLRFSNTGEEVTSKRLFDWARRHGWRDPSLFKRLYASHEFAGSDEARSNAVIALMLEIREEDAKSKVAR
jgi:hypothetical protein